MRTTFFAVLGSVQVDGDDGRAVDLGGRLPRRLLTMLVAAEGRAVSDDRLGACLWDGRPPADPQAAAQVYVSRLRRALGDGARELLRRDGTGYRLVLPPGATDVEMFTEQATVARRLADDGRDEEALSAFGAALLL